MGAWSGLHACGVLATGPHSASRFPPQRLKGEVSQLKRSLQRAETEAKVLWEEMRGQEPKVDAAYVQERVLLRQEVRLGGCQGCGLLVSPLLHGQGPLQTSLLEQATGRGGGGSPPPDGSHPTASSPHRSLSLQVDKLRLLLLEKEDENLLLSDKHLEQVWGALRGCPGSSPLSLLGQSLPGFGAGS